MRVNRILVVVVAILLLSAFGYYFLFVRGKGNSGKVLNEYPDFIYNKSMWSTDSDIGDIGWKAGNAHYYRPIVNDRMGIAVIHPISDEINNYVEQDVYLPPRQDYVLKASVSNIAGDAEFADSVGCDDVGFIVKVIDKNTGEVDVVSDTIVSHSDGWVNMEFDISKYSGTEITMRIESYGGGPCGDWKSEWAAVDYFAVSVS